jgi:hypothetical protein
MYPPLFSIASDDDGVKASFGANPIRVFPFGGAPESVALPYAVWQVVGGAPENYIGNTPDMDAYLVQVDVYGNSPASARGGAEALRDALQDYAHIVSWRGESKDQQTKHYRYSFDINFFTAR